MKPLRSMDVPSPQRKMTRQPLKVTHNNNLGETDAQSDSSAVLLRFAESQSVLARWNDGLNYLGKILKVDNFIEQCYIQFEDDSEYWALFKDITIVSGPSRNSNEIHCCLCQGENSDKPNQIVLCDNCGLGYHQSCHSPVIGDEVLGPKVPWTCRPCVFASAAKKGGAVKKGPTGKKSKAMQALKQTLPYSMSSLHWDKQHKNNKEQCYCYCGGPGHWYIKMLQCCRCKQWFHEACIQCLQKPLVSGDRFYIFACSLCNQGPEYIRRLQPKWEDLAQLCLFNLTMDFQKKYYDFEESIMPWINENWAALQTGQLDHIPKYERSIRVQEVLKRLNVRFQSGKEIKKRTSWWALRIRVPPPAPVITLPSEGQLKDDLLDKIEVQPVRSGKWLVGETECAPIQSRKRRLSGEDTDNVRKKKKRKLNNNGTENSVSDSQNYKGYNGSSSKYSISGRSSPVCNGTSQDESTTPGKVGRRTPSSKHKSAEKERLRTLDTIIPWPRDYEGSNHPFKTVLEQREEAHNSKLRANFINSYHTACTNGVDTETESFADTTDSDCLTPIDDIPTPPPELEPEVAKKRKKPGRKSKQEMALIAAIQAKKERDQEELENLMLKKPRAVRRNVVDKSTLDAVAKREVPMTQLKSSVRCYFGAADRLANGERYKVLARRVTPDGKMQYLVEWEAVVP